MSLTQAERSHQARINASKSTGPKTAEGKAQSRKNAMKHGMRAEVLAMPQEDPVEVAARTECWNTYYNPQSPGSQELVNMCVRATFLSDRVTRCHDEAIASQIRAADQSWWNDKTDAIEDYKELLIDNPAMAVRMLLREAMGCSYLVKRWKFLSNVFVDRGFWTFDECEQSIRLMGVPTHTLGLRQNAEAFKLFFYNNLIASDDPLKFARETLNDAIRPHELWNAFDITKLPDRDFCQNWIANFLRARTSEIIQRGRKLDETIDTPDRKGAQDRALILKDEKAARLFLRYHSEARNGFHRAFASLGKALESDLGKGERGEEAPAETGSPNEPDYQSFCDPYDRVDPLANRPELGEELPQIDALDADFDDSPNEADFEAEQALIKTRFKPIDESEAGQDKGLAFLIAQHNDKMARSGANPGRQRLVE